MSASSATMTLGSHTVSDISNSSGNSILGGNLDNSRLLLGINLYNNGPYGYSSWQQTRMSHNPLSRHLRKNNQYSIVENGRERVYFKDGKRYVVTDRHGKQRLLDEPSVISNYKPISLVGSLMEYNNVGMNFSIDLTKKISMNNNIAYFTNEKINNIVGLIETPDEVYDVLKGYYLEDALNNADSPMSSFEKLIFNQTIYPPQQYTYKSYTRARTVFNFNWNSDILVRQVGPRKTNNFGSLITTQSYWPLDVDPNWVNFSTPLVENLGIAHALKIGFITTNRSKTSSFGILLNHYSQISHEFTQITGSNVSENNKLKPAPLYSRRHTLLPSSSVVSPSGRIELNKNHDLTNDTIFGGEAAWDVPEQSEKYPFYDSYAEYSDEMRRKAKDYTIVPEFKMSNHVPRFLSSSLFNTPDNIFDLTGSKSDINNSSQNNFYKIYSNSDFLKNFDIVLEDHKNFTDPSKLTLKCKVYKKLIPYDGFYPCQRTVNLAEQFYSSYKNFVNLTQTSAGNIFSSTTDLNHGFQNLMTPLFAPGVLFNSIKSGVAVDYPIITGSMVAHNSSLDPNYYVRTPFNKRIPFEALLEPEKHLSDMTLICNEPHPSGNVSSSAFWDGQGDQLYSRMANNFVAEIPNFFLKGEQFTTLASSPQNDPNFGQTENDKDVYTMRIKMYRSMDSANNSVTSSNHDLSVRYVPPQDMINSGRKETITMYSRPSAFGPPTFFDPIDHDFVADSYLERSNSLGAGQAFIDPFSYKGFNYPFTPPYYHGQAWADITFTPTQKKKYSISEILASSSVEYYRFDHHPFSLTSSNFLDTIMNLDASLNIFTKGTLGEVPQNIQDFASVSGLSLDDESLSRWIIQPKFESPILNFADYVDENGHTSNVTLPNNASSASVPIGMWHQYGRIPTETEGIYLQVTDIPKNWVEGRLGHDNYDRTGSLADLCGFPQNPVKLGQVNNRKKISECVVAIPFIENSGVKEFFKLDQKFVDEAINGESNAEETLVDLVDKMNRFIFPPSFDFVNFPKNVDPIAMYVFEFSVYLSQQDLSDIWQNVLPKFGRHHGVEEASISHSLLGDKKLMNNSKLREDVRWMVFKVKQRAASRYYDQVFKKKGTKLTDLITEVTADAAGPRSKIQYNWPYDFFSLVELVKIDASVEFSDVETDDDGNETVVPKVATEENARIQLDTLFPKGKK
tara:strand:- start:264 stop:3824 length:3561 start_codon:yes stop_codon:yes gene_type:complete